MNAVAPDIAASIPKTFEDLIWVCGALCDLLKIENDALVRHDVDQVRELSENKNALSKLYEKTLLSLGPDKEVKEHITQDQLIQLHDLGQRLSDLMTDNAMMLKAEIEARNKVMSVFVNAAKEHNQNTINYSRKGNFNDLPVAREHAALAYNNTL